MRSLTLFSPLAILLAGCGGSAGPLVAPNYDSSSMSAAAIAQYDKNGNGSIDGAELDAIPSLKFSLAAIDTNTDKAITADELKARFDSYTASGIGALGVSCTVKLNGKELAGAVVTFKPEDCMKGTVPTGTGITNAEGGTAIVPEGKPGMPCGLYKITVSKIEAGGSEQLPARYNSKSILGREIMSDARGGSPVFELNLTSP
jgi:hypothetical protein